MSPNQHQRDLERVTAAVLQVQPDPRIAEEFIRTAPIPAFSGKTLAQLVSEGRAEDAIRYVHSISAGFLG